MSAPETAVRHAQTLTELAELGMALARDLQARVLAADDATVAELAMAFHRVSRSVRQTLALEAKLGRDAHADEVRESKRRVDTRKIRVRLAVERMIWTEAEEDEAEQLVDDLDDLLEADALTEDFAQHPIEAHIARIRADLGLAPAPEPQCGSELPAWDPDDPQAGDWADQRSTG